MQSTRQQLDELDALLQRMLEMPVNQGEPGKTETVQDVLLRKLRSENPTLSAGQAPMPNSGSARPANHYQVVESSDGTDADYRSHRPGQAPNPSAGAGNQGAGGSARLAPGIDLPGSSKDGEWIPFRSSWQPSAQTWQPLAQSWNQMAGQGPGGDASRPPERTGEQGTGRSHSAQGYPPGSERGHSFPSFRPLPSVAPDHSPMPVQQSQGLHSGRASDPGMRVESGSTSLSLLPLVWFNWTFDLVVGSMGGPGQWLATASGKNFLGVLGVLAFLMAGGIVFAQLAGWYP